MGIIEFFVLCVVVALCAYAAVWVVGKLGAPAIFVTLIWGVAVLIVVVELLRATGLVGMDPQIPRLR